MAFYRAGRAHQMARLRNTYDFAHWFVAIVYKSMAVDLYTARDVIEDLRENHGLGWRYKTVLSYLILADFDWEDVAAQGSQTKALEWCRDQKRSPSERAERKQTRENGKGRDMRIKELEAMVRRLETENAKLSARVRELEGRPSRTVRPREGADRHQSTAVDSRFDDSPLQLNAFKGAESRRWY